MMVVHGVDRTSIGEGGKWRTWEGRIDASEAQLQFIHT